MKAAALLTPLLMLGLLVGMAKLEVWAQHPDVPTPRPRRRKRVMTEPQLPHAEDVPQAPLLRDPPPPPGYVEPLAGSSAEYTYGREAPSAHDGEPPIDRSAEHPRIQG